MEILMVLLFVFVLLDILAVRFGSNSKDNVDSAEWDRLHSWHGFH